MFKSMKLLMLLVFASFGFAQASQAQMQSLDGAAFGNDSTPRAIADIGVHPVDASAGSFGVRLPAFFNFSEVNGAADSILVANFATKFVCLNQADQVHIMAAINAMGGDLAMNRNTIREQLIAMDKLTPMPKCHGVVTTAEYQLLQQPPAYMGDPSAHGWTVRGYNISSHNPVFSYIEGGFNTVAELQKDILNPKWGECLNRSRFLSNQDKHDLEVAIQEGKVHIISLPEMVAVNSGCPIIDDAGHVRVVDGLHHLYMPQPGEQVLRLAVVTVSGGRKIGVGLWCGNLVLIPQELFVAAKPEFAQEEVGSTLIHPPKSVVSNRGCGPLCVIVPVVLGAAAIGWFISSQHHGSSIGKTYGGPISRGGN